MRGCKVATFLPPSTSIEHGVDAALRVCLPWDTLMKHGLADSGAFHGTFPLSYHRQVVHITSIECGLATTFPGPVAQLVRASDS